MNKKWTSSDFDLDLPVLPPEFSIPPVLSFHEHLRFCGEYRNFPKLVPKNELADAPKPCEAEFVM